MAYITQETKKQIATELKKIVPKNWKYSLSIHNHSSLTFTLRSGPKSHFASFDNKHIGLNHYFLDQTFSGETLEIFQNILKTLNLKNHDRSDTMTDYFDVGYYLNMNLGVWDKPFKAI